MEMPIIDYIYCVETIFFSLTLAHIFHKLNLKDLLWNEGK